MQRPAREEELRHCLTVVSGYLGLALEAPGTPTPEFWAWLQRAAEAATQAVRLLELGPEVPGPFGPGGGYSAPGVTQR